MATIEPAVQSWLFRRAVARMFEQQRTLRAAAVELQAAWRGKRARMHHQRQHDSAVRIQRWWREHLLAHGVRYNDAATLIQATWRGHLARQQYGWMHRFLLRCLVCVAALEAQV